MRTKNTLFNVVSGLFLQVLTMLTGFIVTKFFILYYGTEINGLVGSVNQIISALMIIEAGISSAAIIALYEPLNNKDNILIGKIIGATKSFYIKSGYIYLIIISLIVIFYPMIIENKSYVYSIRLLLIILSLGTLIDYFFFGKYRVLLTADQKIYVINFYQGISVLLSSFISVYLIINGYSYLLVKLVAGLILFLRFILVRNYIKKNYSHIEISSNFDDVNLSQRWGVFVHQIATVIVFNTDMIVLTVFGGSKALLLVGVYVVYNYIYSSLIDLVNSITGAFVPSLGDLLVERDADKTKSIFLQFEFIIYMIVFIAYTSFGILLLPFVSVYTQGITDANYNDIYLVILFTTMAVLNAVRMPGNVMISAAGHFKETKSRAIIEATINIVLSIILVKYIGIYGVLLGTIVSFLYRSTDTLIYNQKYIVKHTITTTLKRLLLNTALLVTLMYIFLNLNIKIKGYIEWVVYAIFIVIVVTVSYIGIHLIFSKYYVINFYNTLKNTIIKKRDIYKS